jgi:GTPase involved in cell partitioning and DNA repair
MAGGKPAGGDGGAGTALRIVESKKVTETSTCGN